MKSKISKGVLLKTIITCKAGIVAMILKHLGNYFIHFNTYSRYDKERKSPASGINFFYKAAAQQTLCSYGEKDADGTKHDWSENVQDVVKQVKNRQSQILYSQAKNPVKGNEHDLPILINKASALLSMVWEKVSVRLLHLPSAVPSCSPGLGPRSSDKVHQQ